jgi:hypothetical protein
MTPRRRARAVSIETGSTIPAELLAGPDVAVWCPGESLASGAIETFIQFTAARNAWEADNPGQRIPGRAPFNSAEKNEEPPQKNKTTTKGNT